MNCKQVMDLIEEVYPLSAACEWDNSGLQAGRLERSVSRIFVALDATPDIIDQAVAKKADMLITHHPLLFSPLSSVTDDHYIGKRVIRLIQSDISCYAMHTNYDSCRMADLACERIGLENTSSFNDEGIGRAGTFSKPLSLEALCDRVRTAFSLPQVVVYGNAPQKITRAAVVPGSGKSLVDEAAACGAEVLLTGDIGHHDGIDAAAKGIAVIDAGHYGLEHIFIEDMASFLENHLSGVVVFREEPQLPYRIL